MPAGCTGAGALLREHSHAKAALPGNSDLDLPAEPAGSSLAWEALKEPWAYAFLVPWSP
jgi:hypothetical protein